MKIIYYAHSLLSRGGDKMVLANVSRLAAHGHEVELCCNVVDTVHHIPMGVKVTRPALPGTAGTVLSALLGRRDADIVLASIIPMACFLLFRSRRKVVYYAQDYDESYYTSLLMKALVRCLYILGLQLFKIPTIACFYPLANLLRKRFQARVTVVEYEIDPNVFYHDPDASLISSKQGRTAVLILSRSDRRKGFDIAQEVINRFSGTHTGTIEVWTVGEACGGHFPNFVHRDFGYVGEDALRVFMSSADVLFYPTRHEGFGLMPIEAMACRCPVVTTTAVPYAVHGENALVAQIEDNYALTDHLTTLFENRDLYDRLVESGKIFAEKYSLSAAKQEFEAVLASVVKG